MLNFLTDQQLTDLYKFVRVKLNEKYNQKIDIEETEIVTGLTGMDIIQDAFIIRFIPSEAHVEWVENKIITDLHKYFYENKMYGISRIPVIERDVWLGKIRYGLTYTGSK